MTRFVHLTDLHISHPDLNDPHLHSDTPATLRRPPPTLGEQNEEAQNG